MKKRTPATKRVLAIDIGGTNVKFLASGEKTPRKLPSGPGFTPAAMVRAVHAVCGDWKFDAVSIGYPGPVTNHRPAAEPKNLGKGWKRFNYAKAFGCPVKMMNDAAMQALGSYDGGRMLFLGLGTGLGSAMVIDGVVVPMELAHLPYRHGGTFEDALGARGIEQNGKKKWRRAVADVAGRLCAALVADYVVIGGGNVRRLREMPEHARRGDNLNAFKGGFLMWDRAD